MGYKKLGYKNYNEYLNSDWWRERRARQLKKVPQCQLCFTVKYLQVHHGAYFRLGRERDKQLFTLCKQCHFGLHEWYKKKVGKRGLFSFTKKAIKQIKNRKEKDYQHIGLTFMVMSYTSINYQKMMYN